MHAKSTLFFSALVFMQQNMIQPHRVFQLIYLVIGIICAVKISQNQYYASSIDLVESINITHTSFQLPSQSHQLPIPNESVEISPKKLLLKDTRNYLKNKIGLMKTTVRSLASKSIERMANLWHKVLLPHLQQTIEQIKTISNKISSLAIGKLKLFGNKMAKSRFCPQSIRNRLSLEEDEEESEEAEEYTDDEYINPLSKIDLDTNSSTSDNDDNLINEAKEEKEALSSLIWTGKPITSFEIKQLLEIQHFLNTNTHNNTNNNTNHTVLVSSWGQNITPIEILRFLRAKQHHIPHTIQSLIKHDTWRISYYGPEGTFLKTNNSEVFVNSPLQHEIFWLGEDNLHCPTLVIRTQCHDGYYYNEDPRIYTRLK